jgi:PAS domain S-box-containing protein
LGNNEQAQTAGQRSLRLIPCYDNYTHRVGERSTNGNLNKKFIVDKISKRPQSEEQVLQYRSIFDAADDGLIIYDLETGLVVEANPAVCRMHGYTSAEIIGQPLTILIHPDKHDLFDTHIQAFRKDGVFDLRMQHIHRDGSRFYAEWRGAAFIYLGRPSLLGIVRDVDKRIHAEQLLHQRVETRTHEQATLLEISHTLASTLDFQPGLILKQLREILEYTHGALFALEGSTLVTMAIRGTRQLEKAPPFHIHLQSPDALTTLFSERRPIRIGDVLSNDPHSNSLRSLLGDEAALLLKGVRSWMWVPLAVKGRVLGGLGVAHLEENYFTPHHAALALSVANQAAITMLNAELYEDAQTLAVLEERQRLARNLHDAVNQSLFSAGLIAEVLPRLWDQDQVLARQSLEDLRKLTRGAMAEMRALLAELRPTTLTDAELGDLLHLLANAFSGRTNIPARVTVSGQAALPAEVQVAVYRICQEALNNVAKHANAGKLEIFLKHETNHMELSIRDDGRGFDPEQTSSGHYGLSMMRERAEAVGALLAITSRPGQGSELTIHWSEAMKKEDS